MSGSKACIPVGRAIALVVSLAAAVLILGGCLVSLVAVGALAGMDGLRGSEPGAGVASDAPPIGFASDAGRASRIVMPAPERDSGPSFAPESRLRIVLPDWALAAIGREPGSTEGLRSNLQPLDPRNLHPSDLAVLEEIIRAAGLDESSSLFDYDDGNGVFEPWELGYQVWREGRLVLLGMGPSPAFSFGYTLGALPSGIGDLAELEMLDLRDSAVRSLPDEVGRLSRLRALHLDENELATLPPTIADLPVLRVLHVGRNALAALPVDLERSSLEVVSLDGNRLFCGADALAPPASAPRVIGLVAQHCP